MKTNTLLFSALLALSTASAWSQTNTISSVSIGTAVTAGGTATGVAAVTPLIGTALNQPGSVGNNLAGLQYVAGQVPFTGSPASIALFALTGAAIPGGAANPATAITSYGTLTSPTAVTTYSDPASKLTANSYSGLTWAAANLGFGSGNFYMIHHTPGTDYFAEIVPGTATSSLIADLKPMSWGGPTAGGPASIGTTGYFAISWATGILSAGAPYADQSIYYLRTSSSSHTLFGVMIPALTSASSDTLDLTTAVGAFGAGGYTTLAFSPAAIGPYGANQFYYLRQDSITGNTILGWLNPSLVAGTRTVSDIANLGGVCNALGFAPDATGPAGAWGSNQFYVAGSFGAGAQSVSFAAIPNHNVGDVFTITPTASSSLDIDVTVVSGPATIQTTGVSNATPQSLRVFTITTTGPGIVTLQARQAGRLAAPAFTANQLQQSFNVIGAPIITNSPLTAAGSVGTAFSFAITALGSPTSYTASPLPLGLSIAPATGIITGTPTAIGTTAVLLGATNAIGTGNATLTITVAAAGVAPIITNSPLSAAGTVGTLFSFTTTASGSPTTYTATGLPAGLSIVAATGVITGTPTTIGTSPVLLGATNASGTGNATLTITVAAAGIVPIITNIPLVAGGTVSTPFSFTITASGSPTTYTATGLPTGLSIVAATGVITGTPTISGTTPVLLGATNATGTGNATLTITVAAVGTAPAILNNPLSAAGTVGTPFSFPTTASGSPTTYTATGLPTGLSIVAATGVITGTPTISGTTPVLLGATNASGTGNATLTITVAPAGVAPIITNVALTAGGTTGTPFSFTITASGVPTTYSAAGLPAGLSIVAATGVITGTPTAAGATFVLLGATNSSGTGNATLTITIASPSGGGGGGSVAVPVIANNPLTAAGTVGTPFSFTITAAGSPTLYIASVLPAGLVLNSITGTISGTPATAGTTIVALSAQNSGGTGSATLTIIVAPAAVVPIITSPVTAPGTAGSPFVTYLIGATGVPTSYTATGLPPGLSVNALTGAINGTPTTPGTYLVTITATNSAGTSTSTLTITVAPAAVAPVITSPTTSSAIAGVPFITYLIAGTGLPTSYTATGLPPGLSVNPLTGAINGTPTTGGTYPVTITATNSTGTSTATLTITVAAAPSSRIVNFSARAQAGSGSQTLTLGFVITGSNKALMVRGVGPALTAFGVANALPDPQLTLYSGSTLIATNTGWGTGGNAVALITTATQLGAFQLPGGSADSALITVLSSGAYTAQIVGASKDTGTALAEVYDADSNPNARLLNASARMQINVAGGNVNPLIIGFVISGNLPKTVLIRGVGPGLSAFGVTGVLPNPQITLFSSTAQIATNANWSAGSNVPQLTAASNQVGAFPLVSGNLDAAMTAILQPGTYTVQITGVGNTSGTALLEIYDVQ